MRTQALRLCTDGKEKGDGNKRYKQFDSFSSCFDLSHLLLVTVMHTGTRLRFTNCDLLDLLEVETRLPRTSSSSRQ